MSKTSGVNWGRWAALAGGVVLVRGVLGGMLRASTLARDEIFYRVVEAAERSRRAT